MGNITLILHCSRAAIYSTAAQPCRIIDKPVSTKTVFSIMGNQSKNVRHVYGMVRKPRSQFSNKIYMVKKRNDRRKAKGTDESIG